MSVTLLVDNDVVIKLARMNAYHDGLAGLGRSPKQVGSLRFMLRYMGIADSTRRLRHARTQPEADRLAQVLCSIVEIELTDEESRTAAQAMKVVLESELDMQEGELTLSVVAMMRGQMDVATGDKRALRSLPDLERAWPTIGTMRGRFVCLEQIFKLLCINYGVARISKAVAASPRADDAIAFVSSRYGSEARTFVVGMDRLITEHVSKPAPGWLADL